MINSMLSGDRNIMFGKNHLIVQRVIALSKRQAVGVRCQTITIAHICKGISLILLHTERWRDKPVVCISTYWIIFDTCGLVPAMIHPCGVILIGIDHGKYIKVCCGIESCFVRWCQCLANNNTIADSSIAAFSTVAGNHLIINASHLFVIERFAE